MFKKAATKFIALFLLFLILGCSSEKEVYTFTFNPPDGTTLIENCTRHKTQSQNGEIMMDEKLVQSTKTSFEKITAWFKMYQIANSIELYNNDVETSNPVLDALTGVEFDITLNEKAEIVSYTASVDVIDLVLENIPEESKEAFAELFNKETLEAMLFKEWNTKIVPYVGLTASVGDVIESIDTTEVPWDFRSVVKTPSKSIRRLRSTVYQMCEVDSPVFIGE